MLKERHETLGRLLGTIGMQPTVRIELGLLPGPRGRTQTPGRHRKGRVDLQ
jgi:hypothetical protein